MGAMCVDFISGCAQQPIFGEQLPPTWHMQLGNCANDNKYRYVFYCWSLLVAKRIFKEVCVSFLMVGHTHDGIDASLDVNV